MRFLCIRSRTSANISASEQPAQVPHDESNDPTIIQRIIYAPAALLGICAILVSLCAMVIMGGIVLILYIVEAIITFVLHMILYVKLYWSNSIPVLRPTIVEENITNIHIADIEIGNKTNDWSEPAVINSVDSHSIVECVDTLPVAIAIAPNSTDVVE